MERREEEGLRRALAAFGGDVWALVDAALAAAARDRPEELRARRDGIVERLYSAAVAAGCSNCGDGRPPRAAMAAAGLDDEEDEEAMAAAVVSPDADADRVDEADELDGGGDAEQEADGGLESKILAIRDFLEDPDQQPEEELVSLLQNLADMDVTYTALQATDIGRHVNGLRKHPSGEVRRVVKQLIRKWKEIVDDWVRLHNTGGDGGNSIIADGDSPDKIQGRSRQSPRVSESKYSPSPQRHNGSSSEKANNNGLGSATDVKRRPSPAPAYQNSRQSNSNHHNSSTSSASAKVATRDQKDNSLLDLDRLDSARRRLQENYQEAQNAKKQRTVQVMDINEIPKPKNRHTFIRKSGGGGLPARHR